MLVYKSNEIFTGLDERGKLQINPTVQWSGYSPGMWENPVTVPAEMNVNYVLEEEHFQRERYLFTTPCIKSLFWEICVLCQLGFTRKDSTSRQ